MARPLSIHDRLQHLVDTPHRVAVAGRYANKNSAQVAASGFRKTEPRLTYKVRDTGDKVIVISTKK